MTATAVPRDTKTREGKIRHMPLAAVKCLAGTIAARNATGFATPGAASTTIRGIGIFRETVDNSGGSAGDKTVDVERGVWGPFANSASGDLLTRADIGNDCYIVDNQTVAKTDGSSARSVAGKVFDVDADGVWVDFA